MAYQRIKITDIKGIQIGQVEDKVGGTGCTVFLAPDGMCAGLDIRGGGPASRETGLLDPLAAAECIHAIVLSGGSAFGLDSAGGVMQFLEEKNIGFDVGVTKVPLVVETNIFDLNVGSSPFVRPDKKMGYEAAKAAFEYPNYRNGNHGVGCGATVGKLKGMDHAMKSGIGSYAVERDGLQVGAVVVVNALGDIYDYKCGKKVAGVRRSEKKMDEDPLLASLGEGSTSFVQNTTLAVIITNARFHKSQLCKIAGMGHDAFARSIRPVHTSNDGDSIFAVSVGSFEASVDEVGSLGAVVLSEAILRAVKSAEGAYGLPSASDLA